MKACDESDLGKFIVQKPNSTPLFAPIRTEKISLAKPRSLHYPIKKSGYYCVSTYADSISYTGAVVFQNSFGELPASDAARLPFFSGASIVYALVLLIWLVAYYEHRSDVLPIQTYITAFCGFLIIEMIMIWGYYDFVNRYGGNTPGSKVYMIFLSLFTAFRNAFSFFLMLIVCLGYGVVKPSLGDSMWKCQALSFAHFLSAILFSITTAMTSHDNASTWILVSMLPLLITTSTFYVVIFASLSNTIKELEAHRQQVKASMYIALWRVLLGSVLVIFIMVFINLVMFMSESSLEYITKHWQSRWFMLDGWAYILYFVDFCIICFIWRPTANNQKFAMSMQLAQDESEAMELSSLASDDDEDDEEDSN